MTPGIAQFMRELEERWDSHRAALRRGDLTAALAYLADTASVRHLPAMTGAAGLSAVGQFYAEDLLPHLPGDLAQTRVSRTVGRFGLADEIMVSFTHDRELPWLLPGAAPTHRRAEVLAVAVVSFQRGRISSQRVLWDHATLTAQLGITSLVAPGLP